MDGSLTAAADSFQRLRPRLVVVVGAADARIERWGEPADYPVPLDDVVDRISDRL